LTSINLVKEGETAAALMAAFCSLLHAQEKFYRSSIDMARRKSKSFE
jgi:hypothetical protein